MEVAQFLELALFRSTSAWQADAVRVSSKLKVPDDVLGQHPTLSKGDINFQWARWFFEGLANPETYTVSRATYVTIFADVWQAVNKRFYSFDEQERKALTRILAEILNAEVIRARQRKRRHSVGVAQRKELIELCDERPRCWFCGYLFGKWAIEKFLNRGSGQPPSLPDFVDIFLPRGLSSRGLSIEIDHLVPFSHGGGDVNNLVLACGWCNKYKSAYTSLYEVDPRPRRINKNQFGIISLPNPFWVVRLLGVTKKCGYRGGCTKSTANSAMTVAAVCEGGSMTPANIQVTCVDHHPTKEKRLLPRIFVEKLWTQQR